MMMMMKQSPLSLLSLLSLLLALLYPLNAEGKATTSISSSTSTTTSISSKMMKTEINNVQNGESKCSKLYWSTTPLKAGKNGPNSLHRAALGHSSAGSIIAVSVGISGVPSAYYLNPLTNQWTSKQTYDSMHAEGATIGRSTTNDNDNTEPNDVFVLFGGQNINGQYNKQVVQYRSDTGFVELSNKMNNNDQTPIGRSYGTMTAIDAGSGGEQRYVLIGGVDDDRDFADSWLLTVDGTSFEWKELALQENTFGFDGRAKHSASYWAGKSDAPGSSTVVIFGGCTQLAADRKCFNDVWFASGAGGDQFSMKKMKTDGGTPPKPSEDAAIIVHENNLYVYGGCAMSSGKKECYSQVSSLPLSSESAAAWSTPVTGNGKSGLTIGGASMIQSSKLISTSFLVVGGCETGDSTCSTVTRQDVNLNGRCSCENGGSITDEGECKCPKDFEGSNCENKVSATKVDCPKNCNNHGTCSAGKCLCDSTYGGDDCGTRICSVEGPNDCSGHGKCKTIPDSDTPLCVCSAQYYGVICSEMKCSPEDCSGAGSCNTKIGKCDCKPGFGGAGCTKSDLCLANCTNHGECVATLATAKDDSTSKCSCNDGFIGTSCEIDDRCKTDFGGCGDHGTCKDLECDCDVGYTGKQCADKECPNDGCSGRGFCNTGTGLCTCNFGYVGAGCEKKIQCLNNCTSPTNGLCVSAGGADPTLGQCKCTKKFRGEDCSQLICPMAFPHQFADTKLECSGDNRGHCNGETGECVCDPAYGGFACEFACPAGKKFRSNEIHPSKDHMNMGKRTPLDQDDGPLDAALGACSGHGVCVTTLGGDAKCLCERGIEGEACDQEAPCPVANCSGNGVCFRGKCLCVAGFEGDDCETQLSCGEVGVDGIECSGHGICNLGKCYCDAGWETQNDQQQCREKIGCKNHCSGHGKCHDSECFCATGWSGSECEKHAPCANKCSGHGVCFLDECVCEVGYSGEDCGMYDEEVITTKCSGGCNGRGTCKFGECFCNPGFSGPNCQNRAGYECPKSQGVTCAGNGECLYNKCFCMPGFDGKACEKEAKCLNDCSGHGTCANGMCYCKPPFRGADCNSTVACTDDCNSRGICLDGKCACVEGFKGSTCSFGADVCPNECSGHGACQIGRCFCDPSWSGKGCSAFTPKKCPNDCSSSGICHNGKCICEPGMIGDDCGTPMPCPEGCRKNGICVRGRCWCRPGYSGYNCSTPDDAEANAEYEKNLARSKQQEVGFRPCPNQCSHNGVCFGGECMCEAGYSGVDCAIVEVGNDSCQNDCGAFGGTKNARGRCWLGKCFCYPGFQGSDCTEVLKLPCPTDDDLGVCSGRGECHYGRCFCDIGFAGKACSTPIGCPGDCSGHGSCHRGRCKCETGFMGSSCNSTELICENNCNGNGACILGACACNPGWSGRACGVIASMEVKDKSHLAQLTDTQATESAVSNPDNENLVTVHQPSIDYVIPSGKTATQNKVDSPNKMTLSNSILPKEVVEKSTPIRDPRGFKATRPAIPNNDNKKQKLVDAASSLLLIEESSSITKQTIGCEPSDCSGRGKCHRGTCYCNPGFAGSGCKVSLPCPGDNCNNQGDCFNGKCVCKPGYSGEGCEIETKCLNDCNKNGECRWGQCFCDVGYSGISCETKVSGKDSCENECSGNGICEAGSCFCKAQFSGKDCSSPVDLHEAATFTANVQKAHDTNTEDNSIGAKKAFGAATLCFVLGFGTALIASKYR